MPYILVYDFTIFIIFFSGSGNYLVNYIHGTHDIETATIKIILGKFLTLKKPSTAAGDDTLKYLIIIFQGNADDSHEISGLTIS